MELVASSSSELIPTDNTGGNLIPENEETPPSSSETKTTNTKRRLEEDTSTEQSFGRVIERVSIEYSVTSSYHQSQTSVNDHGQKSTLQPHKKRCLDDEVLGLCSSGEVRDGADDNTGDSSIITIAPAATAITTPAVSTPILHATPVQVSARTANPCTESSSGDTAPDTILPSPESHIGEKDLNNRPSKKVRLDIEPTTSNPIPPSSGTLGSTEPLAVTTSDANAALRMDTLPKPSPLVVMPVELLSEILICTGSPQHILAVARTCKALCQTLLIPNNQFVWREARRAYAFDLEAEPVYLPDPPKGFFGEAAYAAFVFDSGVCEVCGKETNMMYTSFALKARLCKNLKCRISIVHALDLIRLTVDPLTAVIPVIESNACLGKVSHESELTFYPFMESYCRTSDWLDAKAWIEDAPQSDAFVRKYEEACKRKIKWMKFTNSLYKWKFARQAHYYSIKSFNESKSRTFASKFGWDCLDMVNSTVYGLYHRQKNKIMEKVEETDVRVMMDQIESQLLDLAEKRGRHTIEVANLKNRSDVEKHYNSIRSSKVYPFLPSLPTFRHLPVISLLQSASATEDTTIAQTLQSNSLMRGLLSDQLKQWTETAKGDFAVLLGFPKKWKNASKNVLHPAERATARFQCIRCSAKAKVRGSRTDDGCLDFAAACKHVCSVGKGRIVKGKKGRWDVSNFVKDDKAINALSKIIQTLDYSEDKAGAHGMIASGLAVLCTSCDPSMILDSRSLVGHCHRHDAMELSLALSVDTITSYLGGYPFSFGLAEKLMGPEGSSVKGRQAIESKNYGCRHCLRAKQAEQSVAAESDEGGGDGEEAGARKPTEAIQVELSTTVYRMHDQGFEGPKEKPPPLFNFNGLRSHLKSKHHIATIRDEDFLCYDAVDL